MMFYINEDHIFNEIDFDPKTVYPLHYLTAGIRMVIQESFQDAFIWVEAHISNGRVRGGHFYCELTDHNDKDKVISKIKGIIWKDYYQSLREKFQKAQSELIECLDSDSVTSKNVKLFLYCQVNYSPIHGLSLYIYDIRPNVSENAIEMKRKSILKKLEKRGVLENNKKIIAPHIIRRMGLITSPNSAAYSDFVKTVQQSDFGFSIQFYPVSVQGEKSEKEIVGALTFLEEQDLDVVCLIRGGGSQVDLAWLDNEAIALKIADYSLPVWVGIGHEIDKGVLDVVSNRDFKTPTAVADEIIHGVKTFYHTLEVKQKELIKTIRQVSDFYKTTLQALSEKVQFMFPEKVKQFHQVVHHLDQQTTAHKFQNLLNSKKVLLAEKEKQWSALNPVRVLKRGYSVAKTQNGEYIKSIGQINVNDILITHFHDGRTQSVLKEKTIYNEK